MFTRAYVSPVRVPWLHRFGRRSFLRTGALGVAGLRLVGCADEGGPSVTELDHPLIVGSGFGGGVTALRLAEAGIAATVLERGRRWELTDAMDTFCSMREPDERAGWFTRETPIGLAIRIRRYAGVAERFEGEGIDAIVGAGVGGGSLVYAGMMVQPPRDLFESVFPSEVGYDDMLETWYPKVNELLPVRMVPEDILNSETYAATRLFLQHADNAGLNTEYNLNAIDWDIVRQEIAGELPAAASAGDYIYGLNNGAKGQVDRTYLARAEATGLVEVRPLHRVTAVAEDPEGGYRVDVEVIDDHGMVLQTARYRAPVLFMSAGAVHSTRLLVEARARGDLSQLSSEVGEGWGHNGQWLHSRMGLTEDTGAFQGGPPAAVIRDFDNPVAPVTVEIGAAAFGYECNCMICPSSSLNDGFGSLSWDPSAERTVLRWDEANGATGVAAGEWVTEQLNLANGGTQAPLPGQTRRSTFHPLGGVVMGRAADSFGRVDGHPGLYCVDGALIPGSTPTANPAWTIAAIAERALDTIVREDLA